MNMDIESRKLVYNTMCNLYAKRSGIAHGGNINIETKELKQIRYVSIRLTQPYQAIL